MRVKESGKAKVIEWFGGHIRIHRSKKTEKYVTSALWSNFFNFSTIVMKTLKYINSFNDISANKKDFSKREKAFSKVRVLVL